jgi:hypothetical protein
MALQLRQQLTRVVHTFKEVTFLPIVDSSKTERERRGEACTHFHERFGVLVDRNKEKVNCEYISDKCHALALTHQHHLVADELIS